MRVKIEFSRLTRSSEHSGKRVQDRRPAQGGGYAALAWVAGPPPLGDGYRAAVTRPPPWVTVTGPSLKT
ncbi:hypothetical protein KI387_006090, partial [Taxus chinensis]